MTVKEFCNQHKHDSKGFWLCPSICKNMTITPRLYEYGIDYQNVGSIPNELLEKEVRKTFREDGVICIILSVELRLKGLNYNAKMSLLW